MTERSIVEAAARLRRHGEPYLVATVVNVQGAAYRRPGARMIITRFRWVAGTVSGGALEGDISNQGWWRTRDGQPLLLTYGPDGGELAEDDDIRSAFGLGCDGVVEVLLERVGQPGRIDALELAGRCFRAQKRGAVATIFRCDDPQIAVGTRLGLVEGGELELEAAPLDERIRDAIAAELHEAIAGGRGAIRSYEVDGGKLEAFVEAVLPPQRLFLCGTGHDAVPVAQLARTLGWDVIVYASEPRFSTRERFSMATELVTDRDELLARIANSGRAVGIVMTHDAARDRDQLAMLLATKLAAIGVLGTAQRAAQLASELGLPGDTRLRAVGLTLGAETPQEVAMSMIGELQAALVAAAPVTVVQERTAASAGSSASIAAAAAR